MKKFAVALVALVSLAANAWTTVAGTPSGAEWQLRASTKTVSLYASRAFVFADVRKVDAKGTHMLVVGVEKESCSTNRGTVVLLTQTGVELDHGQWSAQNNNVASALASRLCRL